MTKLLTRDQVCECTFTTGTGQARPEKCEHGNRYWTERQLKPPERKPLRQVSEKRQAEEDAGARPRRRQSTLKRGRGFQRTPAQRDKVRLLPCIGCGREASEYLTIDPAHLWPKGKGGCDSPDCVGPLCREPNGEGCHKLFDEGKLELLPKLIDKGYWVEMAHPIYAHEVSPFTLTERLTFNPPPTNKGSVAAPRGAA